MIQSNLKPNEEKATLKEILYLLRKHLDLSQAEFAKLVEVSPSLIIQVEKGEATFSEKLYEKIMANVPANYLTDLIKLRFELFDGEANAPQFELIRRLRSRVHEAEKRQGSRLFSIICHKQGEGEDTQCTYEIVLTQSLFNESMFRHNWPNVEPKYILVDICDSFDDAERRVMHLKHCYSQWSLNPD